jgi:hypothetical protein
MTAEPRFWIPWNLPADPATVTHTIDPETGIWPIAEWGASCYRGFVSDSRFSSTAQVIPRTNRDVSRKWRALDNAGH